MARNNVDALANHMYALFEDFAVSIVRSQVEENTMKPVISRTVLIFGLIGLLILIVTAIPAWCQQGRPSQFGVIELPEDIQKREIAPGDILNIMIWEGETLYVNYYARVADTGELTLPNDQVIEAADSTMQQLIINLREIYRIKYPQATMLVTLPKQVDREDLGGEGS